MNLLSSLAIPAYAQICNPALKNGGCIGDFNGAKSYTNSVLQTVFSIFFIVGVIYFLWHFVFAAYHMISSEGDAKKFDTAKNEIVFATIGVFVLFSVFAILKLVGAVTGIAGLSTLQLQWPSL